MTPLQSLNDDLAQRLGEMRIVMDELGRALDDLYTHCRPMVDSEFSTSWRKAMREARSALSSYERVRKKVCSETTGDAS